MATEREREREIAVCTGAENQGKLKYIMLKHWPLSVADYLYHKGVYITKHEYMYPSSCNLRWKVSKSHFRRHGRLVTVQQVYSKGIVLVS